MSAKYYKKGAICYQKIGYYEKSRKLLTMVANIEKGKGCLIQSQPIHWQENQQDTNTNTNTKQYKVLFIVVAIGIFLIFLFLTGVHKDIYIVMLIAYSLMLAEYLLKLFYGFLP